MSGAELVPMGIPTICWYTMPSNYTAEISQFREQDLNPNDADSIQLYTIIFFQ